MFISAIRQVFICPNGLNFLEGETMTTSECEFGAGMGKSAVDYLDDFIIWATRLSPEEQEVWNMLCRKRGMAAVKKEETKAEKI